MIKKDIKSINLIFLSFLSILTLKIMVLESFASPIIQIYPQKTEIFANENSKSTEQVGLLISDPEGGVVTLTCESSNKTLLPQTGFLINSLKSDEIAFTLLPPPAPSSLVFLQMVPAPNSFGQTTVNIKLENKDKKSHSVSFVLKVNGIPKISKINDHTISNLLESYIIDFQVQDPETANEQLDINVYSSNVEVLPVENISFSFLANGPDANLTIKPLKSLTGQLQVKIEVSDQNTTTERIFNLWIKNVPIINIEKHETVSMNAISHPIQFSICVSDAEDTTITITSSTPNIVSNDNIKINGLDSNYIITPFNQGECKKMFFNVKPEKNLTGIVTISIEINNGFFVESSEIELSIINTAPEFIFVDNQTINMNSSTEPIAFSISDSEGGNITLICHSQTLSSCSSQEGNIVCEQKDLISSGTCNGQDGDILFFSLEAGENIIFSEQISPDSNLFGKAIVTIEVTDGLLSNSTSFTLTVNSPPKMISSEQITINMNTKSCPIPISIIDYDNDLKEMEVYINKSCPTLFSDNSITYQLLENSCTLLFTPSVNQSGFCDISLTVSDGLATHQSLLNIRVNQRPSLDPISSQKSFEDQILEIPLLVSDDEPLSNLSWNFSFSNKEFINNNTNASVKYENQIPHLILQSTSETALETSVTVTVSDSNMFSYSQIFLWEILPFDDPPEISGLLSAYQIEEDTSLTITVSLIDPDTELDDIDLTIESSNIGVVSNDNIDIIKDEEKRTIFIIPGVDVNGETMITLRVYNIKNTNSETLYSIPLTVYPENNPPIINSFNHTISEDSFCKHNITASDPEDDTIQFEIYSQPINGRITYFNEFSGEFIYVPYPNFHGKDIIKFVAHDGMEYSEPGTIEITIKSVNDTPIAYDAHYIILKNQTLSIDLLTSDVDTGDSLIYRLTNTTDNGSVAISDHDEGVVEYIPSFNQTGNDQFDFFVRDSNSIMSNIATVTIEIVESFNPQYTLTVNLNGEYNEGDFYEYAILDSTDNHEVTSGTSKNNIFHVLLEKGSYRLIIIGEGYEPYEYNNNFNSPIIIFTNQMTINCENIEKNEDFNPYLPEIQVTKTLIHNGFILRLDKKNFKDIFIMKINDKIVNIGNETWPYTYKWTAESSPATVSSNNTPYTGDKYYEIKFDFYDWDEYVDSYHVTHYQFIKQKNKENFRSEDLIAFEKGFGSGGAYGSKAMYETVGYSYFYPLIGTTIDLNIQPGTGSYQQALIDIPRIPMKYLIIDDPDNWEYDEDKDYYDVFDENKNRKVKLLASDQLKVVFSHYAFYMTIASGIAVDFYVADGPNKGKKVRYNPYHSDSSNQYVRFSEAPTIKVPILLNSNYNKFDSFSEALLDLLNTFPALVDEKGDGAFTVTDTGRTDRFKKVQMPFIQENDILVYLKSNHLTRFAVLWSNPIDDEDPEHQYFHAESIDSGGCFIESLIKK